jgi:hypothetical protein
MMLPWGGYSPAVGVDAAAGAGAGPLRRRKNGTTHTSQRPTIAASTTELFREKSTF